MADESKIEWTDATWNPWEGCEKVSPGCKFCYAEARDKRFTGGKHWGGKDSVRRVISKQLENAPHRWQKDQAAKNALADKQGVPRPRRMRVFCASLADVFEDRADLVERRAKLFDTIRACPDLDWLLLTKRPENIARLWPKHVPPPGAAAWPNVWLGCTCENQEWTNNRLRHLLAVAAVIHFVSFEPLLGPIDLAETDLSGVPLGNHREHMLNWAIIGGESGNGARPFHISWAKSLIEQCERYLITPFVKQMGAVPVMDERAWRHQLAEARELGTAPLLSATNKDRAPDGTVPLKFEHKKGGDIGEWPTDLRVREFPSGGFPK